MIEDGYLELIHRAIDGELSGREQSELDSLLQANPEARQLYERLSRLSLLTSALPALDPPADSRAKILRGIDRARYSSRRLSSNPRSVGAIFGTLLSPRLAWGIAAGVVLGIGLSELLFHGPSGTLNPLDLSGTVLNEPVVTGLARVESDVISAGDVNGRLAVDVKGELAYVQFELHSGVDISIALDFDPAAVVFRAFERQVPQTGEVVTSPTQVRISHSGDNRYVFVLQKTSEAPANVTCRIESNGVIYHRDIQLN